MILVSGLNSLPIKIGEHVGQGTIASLNRCNFSPILRSIVYYCLLKLLFIRKQHTHANIRILQICSCMPLFNLRHRFLLLLFARHLCTIFFLRNVGFQAIKVQEMASLSEISLANPIFSSFSSIGLSTYFSNKSSSNLFSCACSVS